jgi:hypothetical protein
VRGNNYGSWPPERMLTWGAKFGPHVEEVVRRTLDRYPHPEMGYRPVLGILRCAEKHGAERMYPFGAGRPIATLAGVVGYPRQAVCARYRRLVSGAALRPLGRG